MMLYYNQLSQKLFTKLNIFLGFLTILVVQLGFSLAFFLLHLTGPSIFGTCGVFLRENNGDSLVPVILFQTQSCLTGIVYGLSLFFGIRIVRHLKQLTANVDEGFQVYFLSIFQML